MNIAYDNNGNTLTDAQDRSFTWNSENRLTQLVNPGVGTATFKYDPFGRRVQKFSTMGTTNYLYDGENIVEEVDNSGSVLARYTEAGIDELFAELRSGTTAYYEQDGVDSITSLTVSGTIVDSSLFDSFGQLTAHSGSLINRLQYTSREFDSETNIYYYRFRYYDPSVGRFISEDPLELGGDGPNFYVYTLDNPVTYVDPMGTSSQGPPPSPTPGQPGGFTYNYPPPRTGLLHGPALNFANCLGKCLAKDFVVTGGSECTPDGRHVPGGVKGSRHRTNQALDIRPAGQDKHKVFCCALDCGAGYIQNEGDHWHIQLTPGKNGGRGLLPKPCDCK